MKLKRHIEEVKAIGADAWELQHFTELRKNASRVSQVEALQADRQWLWDHCEELCRRIDDIIQEIRDETSGCG